MNLNEIGKKIAELNVLTIKTIANRNKELGIDLTPAQGGVIRLLSNKGDMCQKDLESYMACNKSTLSAILDTMEKNNLINRIEASDDSRKKIICLTDKSRKYHKKLEDDKNYVGDILRRDINEDELKVFYDVICKMVNNLERK